MKINEIEQGERQSVPYYGMERIIDTLKAECSDSLDAMRSVGKFLYRGVKVGGANVGSVWKPRHLQGNSPTIFKSSSRDNRRPMDTPNQIQNMIDGALREYGFTALRSNSIFCSGYKAAAINYGVPYLIFPVDGFDFTWSKRFVDLYSDVVDSIMGDDDNREKFFRQFEYDPGEWVFDIAKYNNAGFSSALESNHEIMIRGEYYAIHHQFEPVLRQLLFGQT
jgi:hypothetical protein